MFFGTIGIIAAGAGFPAAGTVLSTYCGNVYSTDGLGSSFYGPFELHEIRADGFGGSTDNIVGQNIGGCWYPSGYILTYNGGGDLYSGWNHFGASGTVYYGTYDNNIYADGNGGSYTNPTYISQPGQFQVHEYSDGYIHYVLYFAGESGSPQFGFFENQYPAAGVFEMSNCQTYLIYDAKGTEFNLNKLVNTYADGWGGHYDEIYYNTSECGNDPSTFYYSYEYRSDNVSYYKLGQYYNWPYHTYVYYGRANGVGGTDYGTENEWYAEMGAVIDSWSDPADPNVTITAYYDGNGGYYVSYGY